jgi:hypothetical protein
MAVIDSLKLTCFQFLREVAISYYASWNILNIDLQLSRMYLVTLRLFINDFSQVLRDIYK